MRRDAWLLLVLTGACAGVAGTARAQQEATPPPPPPLLMLQGGVPGEGPEPEVGFGERVELLGFGGLHGGKVVKNAPFTATATSVATQTLADGNRITRKTQTNLYRDSQGRFRKEVTLSGIGPLAPSGQPHSFVVISDPVAATNYVLEPDQKVARKMPALGGKWKEKGGKFEEGGPGFRPFKKNMQQEVQTESLGTQSINGVNAEGTRYTRTIPAGQIGNDKPISVVSERWYSPDLQIVVMSKHTDPRFGDTIYTVTNIQRQEPAASLFSVPSDYTFKEGGPRRQLRRFRGGPPAEPPAPPDSPGPPPPGN